MNTFAKRPTLQPITKRNVNSVRLEQLPTIQKVSVKGEFICVSLSDERVVMMPVNWSYKLQNATLAERKKFSFQDYFIFWDELDEIIGIKNILFGQKLWLV
jgi:hypothetical protein